MKHFPGSYLVLCVVVVLTIARPSTEAWAEE